jgi:hypothetical protein
MPAMKSGPSNCISAYLLIFAGRHNQKAYRQHQRNMDAAQYHSCEWSDNAGIQVKQSRDHAQYRNDHSLCGFFGFS